MFTKLEIQIMTKTLQQRRDWITKNINNPDLQVNKEQHQQTLALLDSVVSKLNALSPTDAGASPSTRLSKLTGAQKRSQLEPSQIRVLIVDDDELIASLLQTLLRSLGVLVVDIASDGLKGISMLYNANPVYDLVLCDWHMPIKNGLDVHNAMRAAERYMDACFILVTAVTEAKQIREAIDEGVDDYVVKPIEEQKIIRKIARHFPKLRTSENSEPDS